MGLTNPPIQTSTPFSDKFEEGDVFVLQGIRIVEGINTAQGEGDMVVLTIEGQGYGIWGRYLLAQAKAASSADFGKEYTIGRELVSGFGVRPVKLLKEVPQQGGEQN